MEPCCFDTTHDGCARGVDLKDVRYCPLWALICTQGKTWLILLISSNYPPPPLDERCKITALPLAGFFFNIS